MIIILLLVSVLTVAYYWLKSNYEYWKKRGIPGPKPRFFVGNLGQSFIMKKSPSHIYTDIYGAYQNASMVGIFRACTPVLLLRDPELIKDVTIKLFRNFHDNDIDVDKKADPLIGRNPFFLKGEEWKMVRAQLTPGFTSGKMKWLYAHLEETSLQLVKFIENQRGTMNGDGYEAKELCSRFTLNNVASCAFGIEGKCFEEENSEFRQIAKKFLSPGTWATILFFCVTLFPSISKIVSIRLIPKDIERKLNNIVSQTLKYREKNNIVRNDFLHILAQLKKTCKDYEFTDVDVTAHAAGFFGDGYETSSIVMSFALFALAASPEAQSKLREEVVKNLAENNDKIPYEALQAMSYLDGVVNETLRIYPPLFSLQKICTSSHTFTQENEKSVTIEKGTPIILPLYGLHLDAKYFEAPQSFKPERFVGANREKIPKCTFMPFGEGPRACMGQRFGILQVKIGIAHVIKNYVLSVNKKTQLPLKFDPGNILTTPIGGLWLDFKKTE